VSKGDVTSREDGHTRTQEKMYFQVTKSLNLSCVAFLGNKGGVLGKLLLFRQENPSLALTRSKVFV